jgi:flagellin-specific chaperone FliS
MNILHTLKKFLKKSVQLTKKETLTEAEKHDLLQKVSHEREISKNMHGIVAGLKKELAEAKRTNNKEKIRQLLRQVEDLKRDLDQIQINTTRR